MASVQAAQLAVAYCGPTGLTAQACDRRDPCDQKLVLSWGQAAGAQRPAPGLSEGGGQTISNGRKSANDCAIRRVSPRAEP